MKKKFTSPPEWTFSDKKVAEAFDGHVREQLPWYDLATGIVAHVARHYIVPGGRVYDIGASTGNIGRALSATLAARSSILVPVEPSAEMASRYNGPGKIVVADAALLDYEPCDLIVAFLVLMFVPVYQRLQMIGRWKEALRPGGAIVAFDRSVNPGGYVGMVMTRLILAAKYEQGATPAEIISKELSLSGVQRPFDPSDLGGIEVFRFGDFAGWVYEKGAAQGDPFNR